jgi:hypothetical protein
MVLVITLPSAKKAFSLCLQRFRLFLVGGVYMEKVGGVYIPPDSLLRGGFLQSLQVFAAFLSGEVRLPL